LVRRRQYPAEVDRIALMDAVVPGVDQDAKDNADFQKTPLTMPMFVLGGEAPGQVIPKLVEFFSC